jgi:formamidopyrimidine-DNA glycosylase
MPEGHTVHRHARDQRKLLQGKVLAVSSRQGRFERADTLDGRRLLDVEAWGKPLVRGTNDILRGGSRGTHPSFRGRSECRKRPEVDAAAVRVVVRRRVWLGE